MKAIHALVPLLAASAMFAGCESRSSAQVIIAQADASVEKVRPDAQVSTPEHLKPVEDTLAHMKQKFDQHEYKAVKEELPKLNTEYAALVQAIQAKQAENAQIIEEWSTL